MTNHPFKKSPVPGVSIGKPATAAVPATPKEIVKDAAPSMNPPGADKAPAALRPPTVPTILVLEDDWYDFQGPVNNNPLKTR